MEQKNAFFGYKRKVFHEVKEATAATELNLPDYYPDICKILCCRVTPSTENKQKQEDRLSVDGIALVRLLYSAEDKSLHCFETTVRYAKETRYQGALDNDVFNAEQKTESVNYRAIGPRKVEVKASVSVVFEVFRVCTIPSFDDCDEKTEKLCTEKSMIGITSFANVSLVINEDFVVREDRLKNAKIVHETVDVLCSDYKTVHDKILMKGSIEITVLCLQENSNVIFKMNESVPFSQVTEVVGLQEGDHCEIVCNVLKSSISLTDSGECSVNVCVDCTIESQREETVCIISDMYCVEKGTDVHYTNADIQISERRFSEIFSVSAALDTDASQEAQVTAVFCADIKHTTSFTEGQLKINGLAEVICVFRNQDAYIYLTRNVPVEYEKTFSDMKQCDTLLQLTCKNVSCMRTDGNWSVALDLSCSGTLNATEFITYVDNCTVQDDLISTDDSDLISIYFAEAGENAWSIAKENRVSYTRVKDNNGLDCDVLSSSKTLLLVR
ncbi:MAG: DUF3794 domain-containing protein [Clostridia bacterium]|nr:DUF3794 domain-containing protein [Clostridia bacterium]